MRIGRRVTRITATAWALMLAALLVASAAVVHVGFREVEDTQVTSDASRVIHAIEAEVVDLDRVAADWANRDDMYAFVRTRDRRFIASNLMSATFDTLHVHAIAVLDSRGTRVWYGARTRPEEPIVACPPTLYGAAQAGGPLSGGSHRGVMALDDALWLVAAHPIRRSNRTGPPRGTVIFARRLGNDQAKALSERLLLSVQVEPLTTGRPSPELVHQIGSQGRPVARVRDLKTIEGYGLVAGIGGEPVAMVRVDRPRVMFRQALRVVGLIAALFAVLGAGAGIAYMRALRRSVLARVEALDRQVRGVDPSAAAQPTIGLEGDDELADLAASVGEMLARVTEARAEAAESRRLYNLLFDTMVQGCVLLEATPESDGCKIVAANAAFERMAGATAEELEGRAIYDVLPGLSDDSKERLRNVARSGAPDRFEDHIAERGMYVEITAFRPAEQRLACIITDVTARRQSEEELRANEERAHRLLERQTAVSRLAVALGGARDLRSIYAILHEHVRALVETSSLVVARVDAERGQAVAEFAACGGAALDAATLRPLSISDDRQTVCQAIRSNVPVYVADILSEAERDGERPAADAHSWLRDLMASGEADCDAFRSVLCVPMVVQGQTLGAVQISSPRPDSYTRDDVEALAGVATLAGVAIVNVRLIDESNRARRALLSMLEDHRRTERSLRESEARFATAFRLSPEAITISRLADGSFVDVNDGFTKMTGFTRDEAMVASSLSLNSWADPKDRGRLAARLRNGENITNEEVRFRRKDGSPLIGLVSATVIELRGERCILSTVVDITEHKRTNDMLAARLALHEYAATHSLDDILVRTLDEAERLTDSRMGFYCFVDADQQTLSLQAWSTRTTREHCTAEGIGLHYPLSEAGVWADCVRQRRPVVHNDYAGMPDRKGLPDGHVPVIRELVVPIVRQDRIVAVLGVGNKPLDYTEEDVRAVSYLADVAWEIAERKLMEEERQRLQQQFDHSRRLEAIGRLAGGIAHDYNNMLMVILGSCDLLAAGDGLTGQSAEHLRRIRRAAERGWDMNRRLLEFSRQQPVSPEVMDANDLIEGVADMLRQPMGERIEIVVTRSVEPAPVKADRLQMEQTLINLMMNSHDAMPEGGTITLAVQPVTLDEQYVRAHPHARVGDHIMVSVSDTGAGMDADTLSRVFEPFFTTKPRGSGTGLGLPSAFGAVKQAGGTIEIESEVGKGTTVCIYLPRTDEPIPAPAPVNDAPAKAGSGQAILVVEDEPDLRTVLWSMLHDLGYRPRVCATGTDAIAVIQEGSFTPDIVLTDVVMPGMSGPALATRLRQIAPDLPVIFMSGYTSDAATQGEVPADAILVPKPFTKAQLGAAIARALAGSSRRSGGRRVLMVDDDADSCELAEIACRRRGHRLTGAATPEAALGLLASDRFDVLIVDNRVGVLDAAAILRVLRDAGHTQPALVYTGAAGSVDHEAMKPLGVVGVVEKTFDYAPLLDLIERA